MGNPITSADWLRLLDTRFNKVDKDVFAGLPSMLDKFFTVLPSDSAFEEFYEAGSLPDIVPFTGKLEYLHFVPEYYRKIEPSEWAAGIQYERKLLDDEKYGIMMGGEAQLAESAQRVREKEGVKVWTEAFSNAYSYMSSEEGLSLCNSSHTTKSGVSTSTGFDNSGTSAASKTAVTAARLAMKRFKNNIGERITVNPDTIVCPTALVDTFEELNQTQNGYNSAEGTKNMQAGRWNVIGYDLLDDNSTKNWFMVDSKMMKRFLVWIDRVKPEFNSIPDFETFMLKRSVYTRIGWGVLNWRWVYGHLVS